MFLFHVALRLRPTDTHITLDEHLSRRCIGCDRCLLNVLLFRLDADSKFIYYSNWLDVTRTFSGLSFIHLFFWLTSQALQAFSFQCDIFSSQAKIDVAFHAMRMFYSDGKVCPFSYTLIIVLIHFVLFYFQLVDVCRREKVNPIQSDWISIRRVVSIQFKYQVIWTWLKVFPRD